jgi:hypothetical protein
MILLAEGTMSTALLEAKIAEAAKAYMHEKYRLDTEAFKSTKNRAWVGLAGRILEKPGATMPVKSPNRYERGART